MSWHYVSSAHQAGDRRDQRHCGRHRRHHGAANGHTHRGRQARIRVCPSPVAASCPSRVRRGSFPASSASQLQWTGRSPGESSPLRRLSRPASCASSFRRTVFPGPRGCARDRVDDLGGVGRPHSADAVAPARLVAPSRRQSARVGGTVGTRCDGRRPGRRRGVQGEAVRPTFRSRCRRDLPASSLVGRRALRHRGLGRCGPLGGPHMVARYRATRLRCGRRGITVLLERLPANTSSTTTPTDPTAASANAHPAIAASSSIGPADRSHDTPPATDSSTSTAKHPEPPQQPPTILEAANFDAAAPPPHAPTPTPRRFTEHPQRVSGTVGPRPGLKVGTAHSLSSSVILLAGTARETSHAPLHQAGHGRARHGTQETHGPVMRRTVHRGSPVRWSCRP